MAALVIAKVMMEATANFILNKGVLVVLMEFWSSLTRKKLNCDGLGRTGKSYFFIPTGATYERNGMLIPSRHTADFSRS